VIEDACRAIDANNSLSDAWARMNAAEVRRIQSGEILGERHPTAESVQINPSKTK
jgi:hypothetical protein